MFSSCLHRIAFIRMNVALAYSVLASISGKFYQFTFISCPRQILFFSYYPHLRTVYVLYSVAYVDTVNDRLGLSSVSHIFGITFILWKWSIYYKYFSAVFSIVFWHWELFRLYGSWLYIFLLNWDPGVTIRPRKDNFMLPFHNITLRSRCAIVEI